MSRVIIRDATPDEAEALTAARGQLDPGERWAWADASTVPGELDWSVADDLDRAQRRCRTSTANLCPGEVVAILWRPVHRSGAGGGRGLTRWAYCADHMYGRRFEDGRILTPVRVGGAG